MQRINYDFSNFIDIFNQMKNNSSVTSSNLIDLKKNLNKFFKDSTCLEVLYTNNTDKMFFGMKVLPMIDPDNIYEYLMDNDNVRLTKYVIEIDSHLLNPVLDLTEKELTAILLHEVGHVVGDTQPIQNARNILNEYLAKNNTSLSISNSVHYKELLVYGLTDYLSKSQSIFYTSDSSEIYADEFAATYGFGEELGTAYDKIIKDNIKLYENSQVSKWTVFCWTLSLYKNIKLRRISAIKILNRAIKLTGSRIEKVEIENVIKRIKRIDDNIVVESVIINEGMDSIRAKLRERMYKSRMSTMRMIDSNYYELNMQVRNVEDENDALYLMRQINNAISIMEEYTNSPDCDEYELEKWNQMLKKYQQLRDNLSKTTTYKNKSYGLFVNYPDIVENRY